MSLYEEKAMQYSNGQLPFEEFMEMKSQFIQSEGIDCEHSILTRRKIDGVEFCGDCDEELGGAEYEPEDDQC